MNVVITYDISDDKTRTKLHKLLKNLRYNIQNIDLNRPGRLRQANLEDSYWD